MSEEREERNSSTAQTTETEQAAASPTVLDDPLVALPIARIIEATPDIRTPRSKRQADWAAATPAVAASLLDNLADGVGDENATSTLATQCDTHQAPSSATDGPALSAADEAHAHVVVDKRALSTQVDEEETDGERTTLAPRTAQSAAAVAQGSTAADDGSPVCKRAKVYGSDMAAASLLANIAAARRTGAEVYCSATLQALRQVLATAQAESQRQVAEYADAAHHYAMLETPLQRGAAFHTVVIKAGRSASEVALCASTRSYACREALSQAEAHAADAARAGYFLEACVTAIVTPMAMAPEDVKFPVVVALIRAELAHIAALHVENMYSYSLSSAIEACRRRLDVTAETSSDASSGLGNAAQEQQHTTFTTTTTLAARRAEAKVQQCSTTTVPAAAAASTTVSSRLPLLGAVRTPSSSSSSSPSTPVVSSPTTLAPLASTPVPHSPLPMAQTALASPQRPAAPSPPASTLSAKLSSVDTYTEDVSVVEPAAQFGASASVVAAARLAREPLTSERNTVAGTSAPPPNPTASIATAAAKILLSRTAPKKSSANGTAEATSSVLNHPASVTGGNVASLPPVRVTKPVDTKRPLPTGTTATMTASTATTRAVPASKALVAEGRPAAFPPGVATIPKAALATTASSATRPVAPLAATVTSATTTASIAKTTTTSKTTSSKAAGAQVAHPPAAQPAASTALPATATQAAAPQQQRRLLLIGGGLLAASGTRRGFGASLRNERRRMGGEASSVRR